MSLSSTSALKAQLIKALGPAAQLYFDALASFVSGKSSRQEFEDMTKQVLTSPHLLQLHNALIISLFDATATLKRPATPPPASLPKPPPQKRRRTLLPYQGPEDSEEARSIRGQRLKRWTLSMGKRERDRVKSLEAAPPPLDPPRPRKETDEIAGERGVELISERGDPPGSRLPIHLHASTRAPTLQHVTDRVNLICAQNGLQNPARNVSALMALACEAKLKQLITHALTLTSTSHAISSIAPAPVASSSFSSSSLSSSSGPFGPTHLHPHGHGHGHSHASRPPVLTPDSFHTLFTVSPADLPNGSAAAMRFAMGPSAIDQAADAADPLAVLLQQHEQELERARMAERARLREKEREREKAKEKEREKARENEQGQGQDATVKMEPGEASIDPSASTATGAGTAGQQQNGENTAPDANSNTASSDGNPDATSTSGELQLRDDPRWQVMALLAHRSAVRDTMIGRGTGIGIGRGGLGGLGGMGGMSGLSGIGGLGGLSGLGGLGGIGGMSGLGGLGGLGGMRGGKMGGPLGLGMGRGVGMGIGRGGGLGLGMGIGRGGR